MGQGLGENSPVVLTLGKANYEAMISRHGQWVRWRIAEKCPCVKPETQQPDIHCARCAGLGVVYRCQQERVFTKMAMCVDTSGFVDFGEESEAYRLLSVYDQTGKTYEAAAKAGRYVVLNDAPPDKGVYVTAVFVESIAKTIERAECEKTGGGYYRVQGLRSAKNTIDGLYHTAPGDIEQIESVTDAAGVEWEAVEFRQDCFLLGGVKKKPDEENAGEPDGGAQADGTGETGSADDAKDNEPEDSAETADPVKPVEPLTAHGVRYVPPFVFVILNQNLSKSDAQVVQELNGDAVLSFPYAYDVSNDDVITVLSGTYTQKSVITKKSTRYDVIPSYFVDEVISCAGKSRAYVQNEDFILCGTNYIKWLCDDKPADGEAYSISYRVFPTYKVVKSIPQIRTSENQRMPKKAVVKLYDTYGEARGVNRI